MKVFITGATGYIGSNITINLIDRGHDLIATYRDDSSFDRLLEHQSKIKWINISDDSLKTQLEGFKPNLIIHTAWDGLSYEERNNWELQLRNFYFSKDIIESAISSGVKKVIVLGSQAEYGIKGFKVDENTLPEPTDAYGAVKLLLLNYLRTTCQNANLHWYWIRVFSIFGGVENKTWLIPSVISKLLNNEKVLLTRCEQQYNYVHIDDFIERFIKVIEVDLNLSGVYNICNENSVRLKDMLTLLSDLLGAPTSLLEFGALPYREGQNMFISGSCVKFMESFDLIFQESNLETGLMKAINFFKNNESNNIHC